MLLALIVRGLSWGSKAGASVIIVLVRLPTVAQAPPRSISLVRPDTCPVAKQT